MRDRGPQVSPHFRRLHRAADGQLQAQVSRLEWKIIAFCKNEKKNGDFSLGGEAEIKMAKVIRHISVFYKKDSFRGIRGMSGGSTHRLPPTVQFPGLIAWVTMRK